MKTKTMLVYAQFCEYSTGGLSHVIHGEDMREFMDNQPQYKFLCEVVVPDIDHKDLAEMGVAAINKEIIDLQVQITAKEAKKQQLLAIEHLEVEGE